MNSPAPATSSATEPQSFAHLSDLHLTTLKTLQPPELLNKRILGYLSWRWRRRHEHRAEVIAALVRDLQHTHAGDILITGDLTHLGTRDEYLEVLEWLRGLGAPERIALVPGNHDAYAATGWPDSLGLWADYMAGDRAAGQGFPFLRRRGRVAIIGISTAHPTAPFLASGRLGPAQLERLRHLLNTAGDDGLFRIVMMHHAPVRKQLGRRKGLDDAAALAEVIRQAGAELIVHGHGHRPLRSELPGPAGPVPVIGAPSASLLSHRPGRQAAYYCYQLATGANGWQLTVAVRAYDPARACFVDGGGYAIPVTMQCPR